MNNEANAVRLLSSNEPPLADLAVFLKELGAGDVRFRGTTFGSREGDLETFLQECRDAEDAGEIPASKAPQRTLRLVD